MARPPLKSPELYERICDLVAEGKSLRAIEKLEGMPKAQTICRWLSEDAEFRKLYGPAKDVQAECFAEEIIAISDDGSNDTYVDENGKTRVDYDHVQRSKLRVETRKWVAERLLPKKYGTKLEVEHGATDSLTAFLLKARAGVSPSTE